MQVNTNAFTINCQPGSSNCVQRDTGAVQFTYQGDPGPWFNPFGWLSQSALCVWNVDVTEQNYNNPACVGIPSPFGGN